MSMVTIKPISDFLIDHMDLHSASSAHEALSDESTTKYLQAQSPTFRGEVMVGMAPTPDFGGGDWTRVEVRVREGNFSGVGPGTEEVFVGGLTPNASRSVTWTDATSVALVCPHQSLTAYEEDRTIGLVCHLPETGLNAFQFMELWMDWYYARRPSLVVPDDIVDPITDTNRPTITWTPDLDAEGGIETAFEVKMFDATTYGDFSGVDQDVDTPAYTSGIVSGTSATSWRPPLPVADDDYRIYVRIAQTVNGSLLWSARDYYHFTLDVPNSGVPTITATGQDDEALILIEIESTVGEVSTDQYEVQAKLPDGDWFDVRTDLGDGLVVAAIGTTSVYDHEEPNGIEIEYRARSVHIFDSGERSYSAWSVSDMGTWTSDDIWFKHPADPSLSMKVRLASPADGGIKQDARQGVFQALGAKLAVTVSTTRASKTGTVKIRSDSPEEKDSLEAIIDTLSPVLLQLPYQDQEPDRWISFGSWTRTRMVDNANFPKVWDSIDWTEVEKP